MDFSTKKVEIVCNSYFESYHKILIFAFSSTAIPQNEYNLYPLRKCCNVVYVSKKFAKQILWSVAAEQRFFYVNEMMEDFKNFLFFLDFVGLILYNRFDIF